MLSLDLFNTVYERALTEGAVDDLEARHIHGLNTKMLELMSRAKNANPEMKAALKREYAKIKDERDSYYKIKEGEVIRTATGMRHRSTDSYGGKDIGRGIEFARQKDAMDLTNVNKDLTKQLERGMDVDFDREETNEAGIGQDIVNKSEKMARATPTTRAGAVASTVKNAAKWLAGKGGPGREGPTYESDNSDEDNYEQVLDAIAALYGPEIWDNDAMGDLANDLEQANPTPEELAFIIKHGKLPKRLQGMKFTNNDTVQFGEAKWNPETGGDFSDTHDMNHLPGNDAEETDPKEQAKLLKSMIQYYGNNALVTRALDDLYRVTLGGGYYDLTSSPNRYLATLENQRTGKTEKRYFKNKQEAYRYAKGQSSIVTNLEKIDTQEDTSDLITLPVILGLGDHKKKWMLKFPSEDYAQKWEFKHKNAAQIQWPSGHGLAEDSQDSKSWMAEIKEKYPNVKFMQAKMPGAPIRAYVDNKVVAEFSFDQSEQRKNTTLDEKKLGANRPKLGSARDIGKSVRKFRAQRGLEEAGTDGQWSKQSNWKQVPKAKSGKPVDPRGEVTHLSDIARREAERKAQAQKKNPKAVAEADSDDSLEQIRQQYQQSLEIPVASRYSGDGQFKVAVKNQPYIVTIGGFEIDPLNPGILDSFYLTDVKTGRTRRVTSAVNDVLAGAIFNNLDKNQKPALRDIYKQDMAFHDEHGWDARPERLQGLEKTIPNTDLAIPADRFIKAHQDMKRVTGQDVDEGFQDFNRVLSEHGGGIGPKQHWQDLMQERKLNVGDPIVVTAPNEFEGKTGEIYEFSPSGKFVVVDLYNHGKQSMHLSDVEYNQYAADQEDEDDWYDENLNEFAPGPERDDNDEVPDQILQLANRWWNATDDQPKITNVLRSLGWSIAQVESEDDAVQMTHDDGTTYFISADDFDPDIFEGWQDFNRVEPYAVCLAGKPIKKFDYYEEARRFHDNWKKKLYREGDTEKAEKITLLPLNLDEAGSPAQQAAIAIAKKKEQGVAEEKTRLDPKCWSGKKIGTPKTEMKGGVRVNNCVPANESYNFTSVNLTESKIYKLWESAGRKLVEAQLTPAQIQQVFQQAEQGATTAGGNRTGIGQVKDAGSAVAQAWEQLKTKVANSGPVKNVDAYYDQAAEKLKQATGGDAGIMQYVEKYRTFAKAHPVAQSLIYSALIAAAGISGAGAGGAAALGLFKLVDKLLQGEKFSSAAYAGAKTGAMAYGAGQVGQAVQGSDQAASAVAGGPGVINPKDIISQIQNGTITDQQSLLKAISGVDNRQQQMIWKVLQNTAGAQGSSNVAGIIQAIANPGLKESQIRQAFYVASGLQTQLNEGVWDSIKGAASKAAGAVANKAKTVGHNLTTRVTADKLMSAWQSAGSPTDSKAVADVMRNAGVTDAIITSVMNAVVKRHTGGRVAGQLSQTPNAIRQRQARAAKKPNPGAIGQMANQLTTPKSSTGGTVSKTGSGTVHRASATNPNQPILATVSEDQDTSGVESAIIRRIMVSHTDLLMKFGPEKVMQAAEEVAYNVGDVDEIGTSDVSAYVAQVKQILGAPQEVNEKWSQKYKSNINCANPKGFSQKAHCAGRKK